MDAEDRGDGLASEEEEWSPGGPGEQDRFLVRSEGRCGALVVEGEADRPRLGDSVGTEWDQDGIEAMVLLLDDSDAVKAHRDVLEAFAVEGENQDDRAVALLPNGPGEPAGHLGGSGKVA